MGVIMQAFYWDCPEAEAQQGNWWNFINGQIGGLQTAGFTALWLPPPYKAAEVQSMGYDPYDYYDLGDFDQKGGTKTWFGNKAELSNLIASAHNAGMQVYADMVINHNSGGDAAEVNPIDGQTRLTRFTPASRLFPRNWLCFHPSSYESYDEMSFGDLPDLCHRDPNVYMEMIAIAQFLIEQVGFDGFRFDFVKGYGPWMVKAIAEVRYLNKSRQGFKPFCVGECWDSDLTIDDWLSAVNTFMDNPVSAFDFPLHYRLKGLCDSYGFSLTTLAEVGVVNIEQPANAVTFVDNHDTIRDPANAIINDKMMAYAFILTHEGYPCVFWLDYFNYGLARTGTPNGIAALVNVHETYAGGSTLVLHADSDLYIMQRSGFDAQAGLIFVLNNRGDGWSGMPVRTQWTDRQLLPIAWDGRDTSAPQMKWTDASGNVDVWAAPRGFAIYVPN